MLASRPEPAYELVYMSERDGDLYMAKQYYFMSFEASHDFIFAKKALERLGFLKPGIEN